MVSSPEGSYDYIIVGGGTAGSVLASRLSRSNKSKVLLIEAGGLPPYLSTVPLVAPLLQGGAYDWGYSTEPQKYSSKALNNSTAKWPRGKLLGGSSQMNFHINMLNFEDDIDRWGREFDLPSWNRSIVSKYLNRALCLKLINRTVSAEASTDQQQPSFSQCSKPHMRTTETHSQISSVFRGAAVELGIPLAAPRDKYGVFAPQADIYDGKRWNVFKGYLRPVLNRLNLHVMTKTFVKQILFSGRQVIGVEFEDSSGVTSEVYLRRRGEVLLSGGAINSPQILLLSGIGPREHLESLGIRVVADLPVGQNLQDHLVVPIRVSTNASLSINSAKIKSLSTVASYLLKNTGHLAVSGIEGLAVMPFSPSNGTKSDDVMSIMTALFNMGNIDMKAYTEAANIPISAYRDWFSGAEEEAAEGFILLSVCLNCRSRGFVRLKSSDPKVPPMIDPQYLSDEDDVKCLMSAIRQSASLLTTKNLRSIGVEIQLPKFPECGSPDLTSDNYLECVVRKAAITMYHPAGTASMGRDGVLDERLRVKKVKGLRVIDASAFPTLTSGTPNSAIILLAERAFDIISEEKRKTKKRNPSPLVT